MRAKPTTLSAVSAPSGSDPEHAAARGDAAGQMSTPQAAPPAQASPLTEDAVRRPYDPPRILFREPLEAMAAICTPHPPAKSNKGLCPMGPISS
jgi:hypothetical protein